MSYCNEHYGEFVPHTGWYNNKDENYCDLIKSFKFFIEKFFSKQENYFRKYIKYFLSDNNIKMVEWLLKIYRKNNNDPTVGNKIIEEALLIDVLIKENVDYRALLIKYNFI